MLTQANATPAADAAQPMPPPLAPPAAPMHTQTQSTLAPTSEYVRYLLLALPARYVMRGIVTTLFETSHYNGNVASRWLGKIADAFQRRFKVAPQNADHASAMAYGAVMGIGSLTLSASYSSTVYSDIKNIFCEAVAMETGKSPESITQHDLKISDNRIVQKTMDNFWKRSLKRIGTDLLFFPAAAVRNMGLVDLMVGTKALQAFTETWKRKTTMFEDLITFINNKINPRNGLGQAISVGDIFDLYQHYAEAFNPDRMFKNVVERSTGEGALWAKNQPIFQRITELMNLTYAYKHRSIIDPTTGQAKQQADFALPKFIYLLGHDLIDIHKPEETLARIEVANQYGIGAVKEMQTALTRGTPLAEIMQRYPIAPQPHDEKEKPPTNDQKNGVIPKGSTMQLDRAEAPGTRVNNAKAIALNEVTPSTLYR